MDTGTGESRCPNCGSLAAGPFCSQCGQEQGDLFPTIRDWFSETLAELFAAEGRLPRTIVALFWPPGRLTQEWYDGRRAQFVSPLRLYLAAALLFFLAWPQTPWASALESFTEGFFVGAGDGPSDLAAAKAALGAEMVAAGLPGLLIIFYVPVFATLLHLSHRSAGPFVGHLTTALHLHTVFFLVMAAFAPLRAIFGADSDAVTAPLLLSILGVFLVAVLVRVYDLTWWRAAIRSVLIVVSYAAVASFSVALILIIALETV